MYIHNLLSSDLTDHLLKVALNFLTTSCHDSTKLDEVYVIDKLRRFIKDTKSEEDVTQFDLYYNRLKRTVSYNHLFYHRNMLKLIYF